MSKLFFAGYALFAPKPYGETLTSNRRLRAMRKYLRRWWSVVDSMRPASSSFRRWSMTAFGLTSRYSEISVT
ncbi:hypothetical protein FK85_28580 [Halorubrum saccharovorum]|uniref:Uncharacterized protein n=1 Tax=Halorubrum saccharovorum TaxID=2248 RepID=A0A0F8CKL1_9EURY|nr:hypothetical protein FK85_28580 [Halorubrum saccharovorum]